MRKSTILILALIATITTSYSCIPLTEDDSVSNTDEAEQPISYGGNTCWFSGLYDEDWVDPNNPASGEHVVGWYACSDFFATPLSTYATVAAEGAIQNWMVWQTGSHYYQVFVSGWYYFYRRWVQRQSGSYIFGRIALY
jgi:hypothetical protein